MDSQYSFQDDYSIPRHLRKLKYNGDLKIGVVFSFLFVGIIFALEFYFLPKLSHMSLEKMLDVLSLRNRISIGSSSIWKFTSFFQLSISCPGRIMCIAIALISVIMMVVIPKIKAVPPPAAIMCDLFISPMAFFAILFVLLPKWFSFDPFSMSDLMTTVSSLILLGMPVLLWLFLAPVPISFARRIDCLVGFDLLLLVLYFLKHFIFLLVFIYTNVLFVPYIMLLVLTLWDILWMNAYYSMVVSHASKKANKDARLWSNK